MATRTFGWVQDAGDITSLKRIAQLFIFDSETHNLLYKHKIPKYVPERCGRDMLMYALGQTENISYTYEMLKGKGSGKTQQLTVEENMKMFNISETEARSIVKKGGRGNAACSGLIQAVLTAQKRFDTTGMHRPYQGDWPSDSFLRLAISVGMLDYDETTDSCSLSEIGYQYANTPDDSEEEQEILIQMFLSYPPVVRLLSLLSQNEYMTKFEIGCQLGFIGEAGFTSVPQNFYVYSFETSNKKTDIRQNMEGTSDKYARMIGEWLVKLGLAEKSHHTYKETYGYQTYETSLQTYKITQNGLYHLKLSNGFSSHKKIRKIVFKEMLATKTIDKEYVKYRRALIIKYLNNSARTVEEIQRYLSSKGLKESESCILDDIQGFINIGLSVLQSREGYRITDKIDGLTLPAPIQEKADLSIIKDRCRDKLKNINHKYLNLIDLSYDGDSNREFEIQTISFLTNELGFGGIRLGESRKPDGLLYEGSNGAIIDNKAYSEGYSLPISQADEMVRYITENQVRDTALNSNEWWKNFPDETTNFKFVFISSFFKGEFLKQLQDISARTKIKGSALNSENLLYVSEKIKSGEISHEDFFDILGCNKEIVVSSMFN